MGALLLRVALAGLLLGARPAEAGLEEVIVRAKPSVVAVGTYSATDNPRFGFRGSGFAVGSGTLVVTNAHVLAEASSAGDATRGLAVFVPGAAEESTRLRSAKLVGIDRAHDLAVLRIDGAPLPALALATDSPAREGMAVAIIGYPIGGALGFTPVTHRGIVASITAIALPAPDADRLNAKAIRRLRSGSFDIYQLDATAYPGNSGGPVLDAESGEVVAVINMVLVRGTKESAIKYPSGISYAIPVRFVDELIRDR